MAVFMVLICGVFQALSFESCGCFYVVYSCFIVTSHGLDLFRGICLHKLIDWLKVAWSKGPTGLGAALPEVKNRASFQNIVFVKKL
jgi:hypothetical protein